MRFGYRHVVMAVMGLVAASAAAVASATQPLPVVDDPAPGILFLIDVSGSMNTCDAPASGLVPSPVNNCGPTAGTYKTGMTRLRAAQLALKNMLDANNDGTVNALDASLMKFKLGMAAFTTSTSSYDGSTSMVFQATWPIGSDWADVFCGDNSSNQPDCNGFGGTSTIKGVEDLTSSFATPTGEALAQGAVNVFGPCYDSNTASNCLLNPRFPTSYWNANDRAATCRVLYIVVLSDGIPNGKINGTGDPVPVADALRTQSASFAGFNFSSYPVIKTFAIAFGAGADMGIMNCIAMKGGTDANLDKDNNASSTDGNAGHNCSDPGSGYVSGGTYYNLEAAPGKGNAYVASDAASLSRALGQIANSISTGTFSRSRPSLSPGGDAVYTSFFDVDATRIGWKGHVKKFITGTASDDSSYTGILNCDGTKPSGGISSNAIPCWDAGALLDQNITYNGATWDTRKVYTVLPQCTDAADQNWQEFFSEENWIEGGGTNPGDGSTGGVTAQTGYATGNSGTPNSYLVDLVPVASSLTTAAVASLATGTGAFTTSAICGLTATQQALALFSANAERTDQDHYASLAVSSGGSLAMVAGFQDLQLLTGRPTATYADGSPVCDTPPCTDTSNAWKLGDSFDVRPTIVGAPSFAIDDVDFAAFQNGTAYGPTSTLTYAQQSHLCKSGVSAPCALKNRGTAVYIAANDGMVHAFDDATGKEMWAFVPWHSIPGTHEARNSHNFILNQNLVVRDVKFGSNDGDGHWHTVLIIGAREGSRAPTALDVTDPLRPRLLWEWFDREEGLTFSDISVGRTPYSGSGSSANGVGSNVTFMGCGVKKVSGIDIDVQTSCDQFLNEMENPKNRTMGHTFAGVDGLAAGYTQDAVEGSNGAANMVGGTKAVATGVFGSPGATDRVFLGDQEGRVWKLCDIAGTKNDDDNNSNIHVHLFFDPAFWFFSPPVPPGYETTTPNIKGFMGMRAPQYFPADVTSVGDGNHFLVSIGQGDITRPVADVASLNSAFLWTLRDRIDGDLNTDHGVNNNTYVKDDPTCAAASDILCQSNYTAPANTMPGSTPRINAPGMIFLERVLTGPPIIFNNYLIYSEYRAHGNPGDDPSNLALSGPCVNNGNGRIKAYLLVGSPCDGSAGGNPFTVGGVQTSVIDIPTAQGIPSGPVVDPHTGNIYIQTSIGSGSTGGLEFQTSTLGNGIKGGTSSWRQIN